MPEMLTFPSEEARQCHPLARLIPIETWTQQFSQQLTETELGFMMISSSADLRNFFKQPHYQQLDQESKQRCWVAMLFSQSENSEFIHHLRPKTAVNKVLYEILLDATINGHISILERCVKLILPRTLFKFIAQDDYKIFNSAIYSESAHALNLLLNERKHADEIVQNAIRKGDVDLIHLIFNQIPQAKMWIEADDYGWFRLAVTSGQYLILNYLIEVLPDKGAEMVRAHHYEAFRLAVVNGNLPILKRLVAIAPNDLVAMFHAAPSSLNHLARHGFTGILNRLLIEPEIFSEAEMDYIPQSIEQFIRTRLNRLRDWVAKRANVKKPFDLEKPKIARLYFYIIRHLIRRNTAHDLDEVRFLLAIPAVQALAHQAVTPNEANELLRLALSIGNQAAAEILLDLPQVFSLAAQNNFYVCRSESDIDLCTLAQDNESSMRSLTPGETKRLQNAMIHYQPKINALGMERIFSDLLIVLETRYLSSPAQLRVHPDKVIRLPLHWTEFNALSLTDLEREYALKAYYQHPDHTAWRYLQIPNPWIAEDASFVYVNQDNPQEQWSMFEEYLPLIILLYLAAEDPMIPPIDGFSFETRLAHFIAELALIGRAHNWDNKRERITEGGKKIREEFDDLNADSPSCPSGTTSRLFQSVQGHPLLKLLTFDQIKQEMRDFMRSHFCQVIIRSNRNALRDAWQQLVETGRCDNPRWAALNVSLEQQEQFKNYLTDKYSSQFTTDPILTRYVKQCFEINDLYPAHIIRFAGETNFETLIGGQTSQQSIDLALFKSLETHELKQLEPVYQKLNACTQLGRCIRDQIEFLGHVTQSSWPIWRGAETKLRAIISSLEHLSTPCDDMALRQALQNRTSELYRALSQPPRADRAFLDKISTTLERMDYITELGHSVLLQSP